MLQYLLDEHLPGYHLPGRHTRTYIWHVDTSTNSIVYSKCLIAPRSQRYDVVAVKYVAGQPFILCNDGKKYRIAIGGIYDLDVYGIMTPYVNIIYTPVPSANFDFKGYLN